MEGILKEIAEMRQKLQMHIFKNPEDHISVDDLDTLESKSSEIVGLYTELMRHKIEIEKTLNK